MHEQVNCVVMNPRHTPVITFSSITVISSSASQASSLASLIQMSYFGILDWLHVYYFMIQMIVNESLHGERVAVMFFHCPCM